MNESDSVPEAPTQVPSIEPADLRERIDRGEPVAILDVRIHSDYEAWHIEGESVQSHNRPYYEFIESEELPEDLPTGDPLVVLCAEGDASEYVAGQLRAAGQDAVTLEDGMAGWARIYDRNEVTGYDGPGSVYQYHRPATGCLGYLVVSDGAAAVVDPLRAFADRYHEDAQALGAELTHAVDTHCHADHVSGLTGLVEDGVQGVIPAATVRRGMDVDSAIRRVEDGDAIQVGEATIDVLHTPGHTTGMTSYLVEDSVVLTGDSLFVGSVARPDLEAGDEGAPAAAHQLYESLHEKLLALDRDVIVGGGHAGPGDRPGPEGTLTATLGTLKEQMEVLRLAEEPFVEFVLEDMPPRPANYERIIDANLGIAALDDEEAFRMELGPNNCAASQGVTIG
jgi:glyoxylase-like metal-dependent hydrolase (beta-lactamase superfamily II)